MGEKPQFDIAVALRLLQMRASYFEKSSSYFGQSAIGHGRMFTGIILQVVEGIGNPIEILVEVDDQFVHRVPDGH